MTEDAQVTPPIGGARPESVPEYGNCPPKILILIVLLVSVLVTACQGPGLSAGTEKATKDPYTAQTMFLDEAPRELIVALQKYGWALPICTQSSRARAAQECVSTSELVHRLPFEQDRVYAAIARFAEDAYSEASQVARAPERVMEVITKYDLLIGCVQMDGSRAVVTLGMRSFEPSKVDDVCSGTLRDDPFDLLHLIQQLPRSPSVPLSALGQQGYEDYFRECQERQASVDPRSEVAEGDDDEDVEKRRKELEKAETAVREAEKKEAEAKEKLEEAKKASEEADKKAQETYGDPNATDDEKRAAGEAAVRAGNDLRQAQHDYDRAKADVERARADRDNARDAVRDAQTRADLGKAVQDATDDWLGTDPFNPLKVAEWAARVFGAHFGTFGPGDCLEQCGYSSCHAYAQAQALRDEIYSHKSMNADCDTAAMPRPDDSDCFQDPRTRFAVPQLTVAEAAKAACRVLERVSDTDCSRLRVPEIMQQEFDPCQGPLVMCAPESGDVGFTGGSGSVRRGSPLPFPWREENPLLWTNPD